MSQSSNLPHTYYTVSELSLVKDVKLMKNVNIKTLAFVHEDHAFDVDFEDRIFVKGRVNVKLDLSHITGNISGIKPVVILGVLYSFNQSPVISVKSIKKFEGNHKSLIQYHNQSMAIRTRSIYFENLEKLGQES